MDARPFKSLSSHSNVFDAFAECAAQHPSLPALLGGGGLGASYSYGEVADFATGLAVGLMRGKLIDAQGVALLSENCAEWPLAYLAILAAGGTVVPIDANLTESEIDYVIDHSGARSIFCSLKFADSIRHQRPDLELFAFGDDPTSGWRRLLSDAPHHRPDRANEVAVVIYTSGTTGDPKAVELTHTNLLANLEGIRRAIHFGSEDCFLSVLPLHHTFEATTGFLTPLMAGARIVYARSLKSSQLIQDIAHNRATVIIGVPLLYEKMASSFHRKIALAPIHRRVLVRCLMAVSGLAWDHRHKWGKNLLKGLRRRAGMDSLRMMVCGGAPLPPSIARFFSLIGFDFLQGYGLTETSPVVCVHRPDDITCASVGPPLANVEVRIDSPDENGVGEILIRGDNVTPGYRGNQEQTNLLLRDGWLYSGDLGRLEDGHLYVTGRAKNVIVSAAGKNIYPEELEEHLCASDLVAEAVVFGRPKVNRQGEEVHALIVPDMEAIEDIEGITVDSGEAVKRMEPIIEGIVREVNERVAPYKRIARHSVQLEELKKTSTKKIKRNFYQ